MSISNNPNKELLRNYIEQLRQDRQNSSKFRVKYQTKILQLLIENEQNHQCIGAQIKQISDLQLTVKRNKTEIMNLQQRCCKLETSLQQSEQSQKDNEFIVQGLELQISRLKEDIEILKKQKNQIILGHELAIKKQKEQANKKYLQIVNEKKMIEDTVIVMKNGQQTMRNAFQKQIEEVRQQNNQLLVKIFSIQKTNKQIMGDLNTTKERQVMNLSNQICKIKSQNQRLSNQIKVNQQNYINSINKLQQKSEYTQKQLRNQKQQLQAQIEQLDKQIKLSFKQNKVIKKQNKELSASNQDLKQQNQRLTLELNQVQIKKKSLVKKQYETRKQLQKFKQEQSLKDMSAQQLHKNYVQIREELKIYKQTNQQLNTKIKDLQSNNYKQGAILESMRKQIIKLQNEIQILEKANIKLTESIALQQKHKENGLKILAKQKDDLAVQNRKLIQLLQMKQKVIQSILEALKTQEFIPQEIFNSLTLAQSDSKFCENSYGQDQYQKRWNITQ